MGLIVTDGREFFSEEKRHATSEISCREEGVPSYRLTNICTQGRYQIDKEILTDPRRPVLLQRTRFTPLKVGPNDYHVYVLLAPHLENRGDGNSAWVDNYKGVPMMFAARGQTALALACSVPWLRRSAGFVGFSDGWQDLFAHRQMTREYMQAENGNVALTAEIDWQPTQGEFILTVGFGRNATEAGNRARAALQDGFDAAKSEYVREWKAWQDTLLPLDTDRTHDRQNVYRVSSIVMRAHETAGFPGGIIASLSVPWGFNKGDDDLGGYHLVWPRDLVETGGGLLAAGAYREVRRVLSYLQATQEADGHWAQNMWLDGWPYWNGIQMDETALPILLLDLARREKALAEADVARFWPMVRQAAGYVVRNGPGSPQDRWEENPGYSPFTVGAEIAALLAAADLADLNHEPSMATYLRETADGWNACIERWMYMSGTDWCRKLNVEGYYVRIAPIESGEGVSRFQNNILVKNVSPSQATRVAGNLVSPDALALVRFGIRAADDPRILDTVKVIDALLKVETPCGPIWHRYNGDGYGEHEDGTPFDGTGVGRGWPLLTGERAHYELAAGRDKDAARLLATVESFANEGGLIPEQIWDTSDIPSRKLYLGRPSGSAMPLVWAHAEYVKLVRSLRDQRVFDMPPQTVQRYVVQKTGSPHAIWRFNHKLRTIRAGQILRVETLAPALVHWSADDWRTVRDTKTRDSGLGMHWADLPTEKLPDGTTLVFTFDWMEVHRWEGRDFFVVIEFTQQSEPR